MNLEIVFRNKYQQDGFYLTNRNQCLSGGFGNGKTYCLMQKAITLSLTFSNYRSVIARQYYKDLKATTMQTFFKILPRQLILTHDNQAGLTILKNRSLFYWMHLDAFDEQSLRGLEINSAFVDQAEEMKEAIYLVLDSRIGRWDKAEVPQSYLSQDPTWPRDNWGIPRVPNYMMLGVNPDSQFHFIYQRYHPESIERKLDHIMLQAGTDPNLNDPETIQQMLGRDPIWVKKYFKGEWGISEAQIHYLPPQSILDPKDCDKLLKDIKSKGNLYRVLDHGDTSPTACGWFSALGPWHICYREYYMPNTLISKHRQNISDLCGDEIYSGSYADPAIFKKQSQKEGGFWSVSDEYRSSNVSGPSLNWIPADNNEFATRNRINELLQLDPNVKHPITGESPAPRLYFIKRTAEYQNGVFHGIKELQSQRRKLLTTINGKPIYSDDREDSITDHFYDVERYYVAMHGATKIIPPREIPRRSFKWYERLSKKQMNEVFAASNIRQDN